ncbi:hypothetical protein MGI_02303 [Candida albicans P75016]|nr:hypothetical protein MGI_02303 [Candida albicans P75016]
MVHQLSLVSSIPHNKYLQTISTLQALTGLIQPESISTYTLLAKPSYAFKPKFEPGKVNQIEQYYMRCITTWNSDKQGDDGKVEKGFDISEPFINKESNIVVRKLFTEEDSVERVWTLQVSDIPVAGKNQGCCQQQIYESTLVHTHTAIEIKVGNGDPIDIDTNNDKQGENNTDKPKQEHDGKLPEAIDEDIIKNGDEKKTTHDHNDSDIMEIDEPNPETQTLPQSLSNGVSQRTTRKDSFLIFLSDLGYEVINQYWQKGVRFFYGDIIIEIYKIFIRDESSQADSNEGIKLKLLDDSNQFQIKAYININKSTEIDSINSGVKELIKLQEFLKNLFVLEIPDRMFMDSRIKQ